MSHDADDGWTVSEIHGRWAVLRQGSFLYSVPVDRLPSGLSRGTELRAEGSGSGDYPQFTKAGPGGASRRSAAGE